MPPTAREKILAASADLMHRQGYHHTGIQEILQAAGVPKGSFYFYFKSKQDLGLALIDYFGEFWMASAKELLEGGQGTPLARLRGFFAFFRDYFCANGFQGGCPVGNLAQEMGDVDPLLRQRLKAAMEATASRVSQVLDEAVAAGELAPQTDTRGLAFFILSSWQGALIRMKVCKSAEPLDTFEQVVFGRLLS